MRARAPVVSFTGRSTCGAAPAAISVKVASAGRFSATLPLPSAAQGIVRYTATATVATKKRSIVAAVSPAG